MTLRQRWLRNFLYYLAIALLTVCLMCWRNHASQDWRDISVLVLVSLIVCVIASGLAAAWGVSVLTKPRN